MGSRPEVLVAGASLVAAAFQATTLTFDPNANTVRVVFLDPKQGDAKTCDQVVTFGQGA